MIARALYTAVLHVLLPLIMLRLAWRARRQPGYLQQVGERFGVYGAPPAGPCIWVHAVSVGETRAAEPLIRALLNHYPTHHIVLTHMTVTGRATSAQLFGHTHPRLTRAYLPYDFPWAVSRFLRWARPQLGVVMETELWPNLFAACRRAGVPLMLANARLSEKSARGYRRIAPLARGCLRALDLVAAQTEADRARLIALGATTVQTLGNLKFDITPPAAQLALGAEWRQRIHDTLGPRPVLLAASTRDNEEDAILDAFVSAGRPGVLLLVPRHPERCDAVAAQAGVRGLHLARRSQPETWQPDTDVILGDSLGEMFAYYRAADLAFVGGSLAPLGGQNLIEACAVGVPVLVGPHTFNFDQVTREAIAAGAARRIEDARQLIEVAQAFWNDPPRCNAMGQAGRAFADQHRGATARLMQQVAARLGAPALKD